MDRKRIRVEDLDDHQLLSKLTDFGFTFVDAGATAQRIEKAPMMVLSTAGGNTPLIRIFTYQFTWENPRVVDPAAAMRHQHMIDKESVWVDLNFNLYLNKFEVSQAVVKMTPNGVPVPGYRGRTLLNRSIPIVLQKSDESIETLEAYNALPDYKQKEFDIEIVGPLMVERIRRYLQDHHMVVYAEDLRDRSSNPHLRHALTDEQRDWIAGQINLFITGGRDILESEEFVPKGETNEDFPAQVNPSTTNVMIDKDQISY